MKNFDVKKLANEIARVIVLDETLRVKGHRTVSRQTNVPNGTNPSCQTNVPLGVSERVKKVQEVTPRGGRVS